MGAAIASPVLVQLLSSCTRATAQEWEPLFFNTEQVHTINNLVDIILPSNDTPGALDVNVPQFLDLVLAEVITGEEQTAINKGADVFADKFELKFKKEVIKGQKEDFEKLTDHYFNIPEEEQEAVFELIQATPDEVGNTEEYFLYKYLIFIRHYTLLGYFTSKEVGTEVLSYVPYPGSYEGCIPLDEAPHISSI